VSRTHITSKGVDIVTRSCRELESIDLAHCPRIRSASFDGLLSLPRLKALNLIGTWKLSEDNMGLVDKFLDRGIHLGVSLELCSFSKQDGGHPKTRETALSVEAQTHIIEKMSKLGCIDLRITQDVATRFLNHPLLPLFAPSLVSMDIGSRNTPTPHPSLSPNIGLLTSLTSLAMYSYDFSTIPKEFADLAQLKSLTISNCKCGSFTEIPEEITSLHSLTSLNLSGNKLRRVPAAIRHLTNLTKLNVSNNDIVELSEEIGELVSLRRLNVGTNKLTTLPSTLGRLSRLERLDCSRNNLCEIPPLAFENLSSIEVIDLQSNRLSCVPHTIALPELKELHLNDNLIESLPDEFGVGLTSIRKLILHHNRLTHLPQDLAGLHGLKFLSLHTNTLECLPLGIECLTSLKTLELSCNRLRELPPTMAFLQQLRKIELQSNCFISLSSLRGIIAIDSLKSVQFDPYLQEGHSERCMCKFCVFSRFDEAHFDDIVEGDQGFELELINLFFTCTENDFCSMIEALESSNFHSIFFVSHKIKGALSNMGALKLSQLCTVLEKQARLQCISSCREIFSQLQSEYGHIKHVLSQRLHNYA